MFFHVQQLINPLVDDDPDPAAANALQEGLGGQFSEMRTMMQYLFQAFNFRGTATPYKDLIQGIGSRRSATSSSSRRRSASCLTARQTSSRTACRVRVDRLRFQLH
jgi:Manganese containing catalase